MDNGNQINFQDFNEIQPEQDYIVFGFSKNNKKFKNYDKALEKFKSSLSQSYIYITNNFDHFNIQSKCDGILIDEQNNQIDIIDEAIVGTQLLIKKDKSKIYMDRKKHLINIDPHIYKPDAKKEEEIDDQNFRLEKLDQLIKEEKIKNKKKAIQKKKKQ